MGQGRAPDEQIRRRFMAWLAVPKGMRKPPTQADLARDMGCSPEHLSRLKNLPEFVDARRDYMSELITEDDIYEIIYAMTQEAKKGSVAAAKVIIELSGLMKDISNRRDALDKPNFEAMEDDELERLVEEEEEINGEGETL